MIGDELPPIPDVVAPIRAIRCWAVRNDLLHSVNGTVWTPGKRLTAVCNPNHGWVGLEHFMDEHDSPGPPDSHGFYGADPLPVCGIYGFKSYDYGIKQDGLSRSDYVWGEVDLSGCVMPYEHGYRAQFARPVLLYRTEAMSLTKVAEKYQLTVIDRPGAPPPPVDLVALAGSCLDTVARHLILTARAAWRNRHV